VALPAYQDYSNRAKISGGDPGASACRTSVTEIYQSGNSATQAADSWGCEVTAATVGGASKYVKSIHTTVALVQIAIQGFATSAGINGAIVSLAPMRDATTMLTKADVGE